MKFRIIRLTFCIADFLEIWYNLSMEKIIITATAESIEQVKQLLEAGVDRIYVGEKDFGLRLPTTFSHEELREIA